MTKVFPSTVPNSTSTPPPLRCPTPLDPCSATLLTPSSTTISPPSATQPSPIPASTGSFLPATASFPTSLCFAAVAADFSPSSIGNSPSQSPSSQPATTHHITTTDHPIRSSTTASSYISYSVPAPPTLP